MYPYNTYQTASVSTPKPDKIFIELLQEAMSDEATDIQYYEKLQNSALDIKDKEVVRCIRMDEQKHLNSLRELYQMLTGEVPSVIAKEKPMCANLYDDYAKSVFGELEGMEFYRKLYFMCAPEHRDRIFEIMTDEQAHAVKMQHLFSKAHT